MARRPVHVGCSGWVYPHWRELFYPKGVPQRSWLSYYAQHFETVEVNSTFYRLASPSAAEGWVEQSPDGFLFAVKASRYLTHIKRLTGLKEGIKRFYERLEALTRTQKFGPVLWQLPENFHRDDERLAGALAALPAGRHAFEFRHPSWFVDDVYGLLRSHGAALVIGDDPSRPFQSHELTTDWTYIRFHRGNRGRGGNYSTSEIDDWAQRIAGWRRRVEVFAFYNNDWEGYAIRNAKRLIKQLDG
ncbi:MAG: DUF72 domain-containing protein [Solirubrobacterales bacterium]